MSLHRPTPFDTSLLVAWVNHFMSPLQVRVEKFPGDLRNGLVLIQLYEHMYGAIDMDLYECNPRFTIHSTRNLSLVMERFRSKGVKICVSPQDVAQGDVLCMRRLMTEIVKRYISENKNELRNKMRTLMESHDIITEESFEQSLHDGTLLSVLIGKEFHETVKEENAETRWKMIATKIDYILSPAESESIDREIELYTCISMLTPSEIIVPQRLDKDSLIAQLEMKISQLTSQQAESTKTWEQKWQERETDYRSLQQDMNKMQNSDADAQLMKMLQDRIKALEQENELSKREMRELRTTIVMIDPSEDQSRVLDLENQIEQGEKRYDDAVKTMKSMNIELDALRFEVEERKAMKEKDDVRLLTLNRERERMEEEMGDLQLRMTEEKIEADEAKSRMAEITLQMEHAKEERSTLQARQSEFDEAVRRFKKVEEERTEAEKKMAEALELVQKMRRERDDMVQKLKKRLGEENSMKAREKQNVVVLKKEKDQMMIDLKTKQSLLTEQADEIGRLKDRMEGLNQEREAKKASQTKMNRANRRSVPSAMTLSFTPEEGTTATTPSTKKKKYVFF
ncbi:tankyrase 1 binding protein 1 [Planoprotostelium fungivorum]|uniref:Tankyrase 1 binding protein 1 n=1 Tax=Planoprotostelium fungivorum TaxID=1890364 RepID=A0A2P6NBV0_9EUKA|nr:tankyrase 1 binding protein 1 [Planoprotostelium fungivorum]